MPTHSTYSQSQESWHHAWSLEFDCLTFRFFDKTKNHWEEREDFEKVPGKYDLLIMDYDADKQDEVDAPVEEDKKKVVKDCTLDKRVQLLIELICNVKAMEEMLKEMKYDTQKAPLG